MDERALIIDLHRDGERQGPGSTHETRRAVELSGLRDARDLTIADIGCGTGASTLVLAEELDAHVVAVDLVSDFLAQLAATATRRHLDTRITPLVASMDALPFPDRSFDAIWSEGAIYNVGFRNGVSSWRRFLAPGGVLAVSELTWLTHNRPAELEEHWTREYPEVGTASAKMEVLEECGYSPIGYFPLPEHCWFDTYYRPMQDRFAVYLARHDHSEDAQRLVAADQHEIELYERFSSFVGYGFFVARRTEDPV